MFLPDPYWTRNQRRARNAMTIADAQKSPSVTPKSAHTRSRVRRLRPSCSTVCQFSPPSSWVTFAAEDAVNQVAKPSQSSFCSATVKLWLSGPSKVTRMD